MNSRTLSIIKNKFKATFIFRNYIVREDYTLVTKPDGKNILILSPHPDDDVIGLGGTIRKHALAKDNVTVLYLTDGSIGVPHPDQNALVEERRKEAITALSILGVDKYIFWNYPDGKLKLTTGIVKQLVELIQEKQTDIIYSPSLFERLRDHTVTFEILINALERIDKPITIYLYEVWNPLIPNLYVDISDVIEIKESAIRAHKTQLAFQDFSVRARGLNLYRAIHFPKMKYVEAFCKCSRLELLSIMNYCKPYIY